MGARSEQRIFISYRRSDCQSQANGLHDGLKHRLSDARIFMDIDSIPPGADFEEHIRGEIEQCDVVLVLIGDEWLDPRPGTDLRRIDEPNDFVRLEVESSLAAKHVRVIPLLVEGAPMPSPDELPDSIRHLARFNAFELSDQRWSSDIERLSQQLRQIAAPDATTPSAPAPAETGPTMSFDDVDDAAIRYALVRMPDTFKTKDVSEHPAVLATHTEVSQLRNYHTIIGRYLMQNRTQLGLAEPSKPVDNRGSVWFKRAAAAPTYTAPRPTSAASRPNPALPTYPRHGAPPAPAPVAWAPMPPAPSQVPKVMILLPLLTCGFASWVPPLWVAHQRPYDRTFRKRMWLLAAGLGAAILVGVTLLGSAPTDSEGTPTGPASDVGVALVLLAMVAGVVVAVVYRNPGNGLPGTEAMLVRRESRERYRRLVESDRPLALSMHVGRPDLARDYDDGGLLDLNSLSAQALETHGGLSRQEAAKIVEVRTQLGRFVNMDEVLVYADLPEPTVNRLRDVAVFV